ncbi:hypothetical protein H4217_007065 [Coemansia sp. RSA 1939]|nr:hypothetical protein H4217_007065 [Coemansia sp. RSA 1939]KAJ2610205.1 hypothetical protein EV177_004092 [Coemansia sp. RSA 1804]KAJ2692491.1 hypothetical protein GGH99_001694 [Coemansia sp. RSA 1285]
MLGSVHNQNKENAVLGSVARTGKAGLLDAKGGGTNNTLQPGKGGKGAVSDKAAQFGTPAHPNTMPPGKQKALDGKQSAMVTRKGLRDTLAQTPLTRNTKPTQRSVAQKADKTAMTVKKRRLGLLFASDIQNENKASIESSEKQQNMEILQLLEPEYAPSVLSASLSFNALDEFGCDLDVALVPTTQLSTSKAEARKLPELDLGLEPLIEVMSTPRIMKPLNFGNSKIPQPGSFVFSQLECKPVPLVAHSLYPSRIPHLKRKR